MIDYKDCNITLKAGSRKEVIHSLANFCNVPFDRIKNAHIKEIYQKYSTHPYYGISQALWQKYNPNTQRENPSTFKAYRYHNTGSNGQIEWFSKGLQTKDYGIREFIYNLKKFYNLDLSEFEEKLASKCLEKNRIDNDDGPFAFISYDFAEGINGFDIPEVFTDFKCEQLNKLLIQAQENLLATTVEFWYHSPMEMLDRYIRAYCSIILGDGDFEVASFEINQTIPFENIVSVKLREMKPQEYLKDNKSSVTFTPFSLTMLNRSTNKTS